MWKRMPGTQRLHSKSIISQTQSPRMILCTWQFHFRPQTLLPTISSKTQSNVGFILSPSSLASILSLYRQAFHLHNIKRKEHCFKQSEMRISFIIFLFLRSSFIYMKMKFISSNFVTYINISLDKLFLLILYLSENSGIDVILCINDYLPESPPVLCLMNLTNKHKPS